MLEHLGVDREESRLVSQLPVLPQHRRRLNQTGTVKAGNFVTFFAQINFFLKNALR
jgi:hypothetical protein